MKNTSVLTWILMVVAMVATSPARAGDLAAEPAEFSASEITEISPDSVSMELTENRAWAFEYRLTIKVDGEIVVQQNYQTKKQRDTEWVGCINNITDARRDGKSVYINRGWSGNYVEIAD